MGRKNGTRKQKNKEGEGEKPSHTMAMRNLRRTCPLASHRHEPRAAVAPLSRAAFARCHAPIPPLSRTFLPPKNIVEPTTTLYRGHCASMAVVIYQASANSHCSTLGRTRTANSHRRTHHCCIHFALVSLCCDCVAIHHLCHLSPSTSHHHRQPFVRFVAPVGRSRRLFVCPSPVFVNRRSKKKSVNLSPITVAPHQLAIKHQPNTVAPHQIVVERRSDTVTPCSPLHYSTCDRACGSLTLARHQVTIVQDLILHAFLLTSSTSSRCRNCSQCSLIFRICIMCFA
ncbi:hypothetical protein SESBI_02695 [Sesbania bispinosa]|nr:hypothetical protein SESBI_02695 [Sesbania bispinosa]